MVNFRVAGFHHWNKQLVNVKGDSINSHGVGGGVLSSESTGLNSTGNGSLNLGYDSFTFCIRNVYLGLILEPF